MEGDILKEVAQSEIPKVLEVMRKDFPEHFLAYQYITKMEEIKKANAQALRQVLYRYGEINTGVYVLQTTTTYTFDENVEEGHGFFLYTLNSDLTDLSKVLMETSKIPWSDKRFYFEMVLDRFIPVVQEMDALKGVKKVVYEFSMLWLPPDEKCKIQDLPDDVYLDSLDISHVPEINRNWAYKSDSSEQFIRNEISSNFGIGLFRKNDKRMLCYAINYHYGGGIFNLHTDPEFRRKGYAEIIVRSLAKRLQEQGSIPFATVDPENIPSQQLFMKIGFKYLTRIAFIL